MALYQPQSSRSPYVRTQVSAPGMSLPTVPAAAPDPGTSSLLSLPRPARSVMGPGRSRFRREREFDNGGLRGLMAPIRFRAALR